MSLKKVASFVPLLVFVFFLLTYISSMRKEFLFDLRRRNHRVLRWGAKVDVDAGLLGSEVGDDHVSDRPFEAGHELSALDQNRSRELIAHAEIVQYVTNGALNRRQKIAFIYCLK